MCVSLFLLGSYKLFFFLQSYIAFCHKKTVVSLLYQFQKYINILFYKTFIGILCEERLKNNIGGEAVGFSPYVVFIT